MHQRWKQRTVESLIDTGTSPNLVQSSFLPPNWHKHFKHVKAPLLRTSTKQAVTIKGLISLHVCMEYLHADAWFVIVENLAMDPLLGTSYVSRCILGLFPAERKAVLIHFYSLAILTSLLEVV